MKDDAAISPEDSLAEEPAPEGTVDATAARQLAESDQTNDAEPSASEDLVPEEEFPEDHGEGSEVPEDHLVDPNSPEFPPLAGLLEALFFTSQKPLGVKEILTILRGAASASPDDPGVQAFAKVKEPQIRQAVEWLENHYASSGRSFQVRESAAGWQLVTCPDFAPWLRQLFPENRPAKLSSPALETLAIIAYRQPITRADLEAVRGVAVDGVMQTLLDRGLVKIAGRAEVPGRPLLYETTQHFMEHFGLKNLEELPNSQELRTVALPKAPVPEPEPAPTTETTSEADTPAQAEAVLSEENTAASIADKQPEESTSDLPDTADFSQASPQNLDHEETLTADPEPDLEAEATDEATNDTAK
jgi:segregation and condensation protein B